MMFETPCDKLIKLWRYYVTWVIIRLLYPPYECEMCVGQEPWRGCYCAYYDAYGPAGVETPRWVEIARSVHTFFTGYNKKRLDSAHSVE